MLLCEKCGTNGITLPCPSCGWVGEALAQPHRIRPRKMGFFYAGTVVIVLGSFAFLLPLGLLWKLCATAVIVSGGFRLLAMSRGD
jgi:hypothetical protein